MKPNTYFEPDTHVWVHSAKLSDRYPGTVMQRQSGVYRIKMIECGSEILVKSGDVSRRVA